MSPPHLPSHSKTPLILSILLLIVITLTSLSFVTTTTTVASEPQCHLLHQHHCSDMSCGVPFSDPQHWNQILSNDSTISCECTWGDIGSRFTLCDENTSEKSLVYYYLPPVTCSGGVALPSPIHHIPCEQSCDAGSVFDRDSHSCQPCQQGTYSPSQTIQFSDFRPSKDWPSQFDSYCVREENDCEPWQLRGDYIDSGDNLDKHNLKSVLVYRTEVAEHSKISFEYMVFGEQFYISLYDYMEFTIRNSRGTASTVLKKAIVDTWTRVEYDVEPGFVEFTWMYQKDKYASSSVAGGDRAKVRNIQVSNLVAMKPTCQECPKGTYAEEEGSSECIPCPPNTYAPETKSSTCIPCPAFQKSYGGASKCEPANMPCTMGDYYEHPSSEGCQQGKQQIQYHWIQPQLCNASLPDSVQLPPSKEIDCKQPVCHPGEEPQGYDCVQCSQMEVSTDGTSCSECELGAVPNARSQYITQFTTESKTFTTGCTGQCQSHGWRFLYSHADSGDGNGVSTSWIETKIEPQYNKEATVSLSYTLQCSPDQGELQILVDGSLVQTQLCTGCSNATRSTKITLPAQDVPTNHTLRINYRTFTLPTDATCDMATIQEIAVTGLEKGGSTSCLACEAGYKAVNGKCEPCPAGSKSVEKSTACEPCAANTFSKEGSGVCHSCGQGMVSGVGASQCTWAANPQHYIQKVGDVEREFDLSALARELEDKAVYNNNDGWRYYVNLDAHSSRKNSGGLSQNPCSDDSFACRTNSQMEIQDLGNSPSFQAEVGSLSLTAINYEGNCANRSISADGRITSSIMMVCSLSASSPSLSVAQENDCSYFFKVESLHACPLCRSDDFYPHRHECVNGEAKVSYTSIGGSEHMCFSGYTPPTNETTTEGCKDVVISRFQWWIVLMIFSVIAAIALIFLLVSVVMAYCSYIFYSKYRKVETEKQKLLATRQIVEMPEAEEDEMDMHVDSSRNQRVTTNGSVNQV